MGACCWFGTQLNVVHQASRLSKIKFAVPVQSEFKLVQASKAIITPLADECLQRKRAILMFARQK